MSALLFASLQAVTILIIVACAAGIGILIRAAEQRANERDHEIRMDALRTRTIVTMDGMKE